MQISDNTAKMGTWFHQNTFVDRDKVQKRDIISEKKQTGEEEKAVSENHDFCALCKEFFNVSFVVVDEIREPQPEYSGICNTSAFGNLFGLNHQLFALLDVYIIVLIPKME